MQPKSSEETQQKHWQNAIRLDNADPLNMVMLQTV